MWSFPEIRLILDDSIEKAFKMTKLLDELAAERQAREEADKTQEDAVSPEDTQ